MENEELELMCEAFYDHDDGFSGSGGPKWKAIPDGSKEWVRCRMRAALGAVRMTTVDRG